MHLNWLQKSVGVKIAGLTSLALIFVITLLLLIFSVLDVSPFSTLTFVQIVIVMMGLVTFVAVLLIVLTINVFVQRPLAKLADAMRTAEGGNFLVRSAIESTDELGELSGSFNTMLAKLTELEQRKLEAERRLVMAQESVRYKDALEEKGRQIEHANAQLQTSLQDLKILYEISQALSSTIDLAELYGVLSDVFAKTLGIQEVTVLLKEKESDSLRVVYAAGFTNNQAVCDLAIKMGEGAPGRAALTRTMVYVEDRRQETNFLGHLGKKLCGSMVSLPLMAKNEVIGVLNVSRPDNAAFSEVDLDLLKSVASQVAIALQNAHLYAKTKELALTDELTGLYNRRHFHNMLTMEFKRAMRFGRPLSLLMIDVDYFKHFNDTFGHTKGDEVLKAMAKVIATHIREVDVLARFGGEEFVVILTDTTLQHAYLAAEKLRITVKKGLDINWLENSQRALTVSIGVSNYPALAKTGEDLLSTADVALYQAKTQGRDQVVIFVEQGLVSDGQLPQRG